MMTNFKKIVVNSIFMRLKAKEIYDHIAQGQENVKPASASVLL